MSQKVRIVYKNLWRNGTITSYSSEHPQFPVENTQDDDKALHWRSRYGSGTGNGYFVVATTNKYIDFDEGGAELTGEVALGEYNGQTLATAIAVAMNAAPSKTLTYTCTYDELTAKFTIAAGANFTLRWKEGTHKATDISDLCGHSDLNEDTGASSYTSDYRRIHSYETITLNMTYDAGPDMTGSQEYNFIALLNHNLSSSSSVQLIVGGNSDYVVYNGNNVFNFLPALRSGTSLVWFIYDKDNSSSYIQIGTIIVGKYIEFTPYVKAEGHGKGEENPSLIDLSDSQNLYVDDKPRLFKRSYPFEGLSNTDASNILLMQEECADHKGIVVCTDPDNPNTASEWVTLAELNEVAYGHVNYWNWTMNVREHK